MSKSKRKSQNVITTARQSQCTCDPQRPGGTPDIYQLSEGSSLNKNSHWNLYYDTVCGNETVSGLNLTLSRLRGLAVKKVFYSTRNCLILPVQTIVTVCFLWIGLAMLKNNTFGNLKISLTTKALEGITVVYTVADDEESAASKMAEVYKDSVKSSGGKPSKFSHTKMSGSLSSRNLMLKRNIVEEPAIFIGAIFEAQKNLSSLFNITALYNLQAYHAEPISVATVMMAIHRYCTVSTGNMTKQAHKLAEEQTVDLAVQPLPLTVKNVEGHLAMMCQKFCIHSSLVVVVSLTFLTSVFAVLLIKERMRGSKHLQYLSGVNTLTFYISNFLWDIIIYILECVIIFSPVAYFSNFSCMFQSSGILLMFSLLSYGMASLPLIYSAQSLFRNSTVCVVVLFITRITVGALVLLFSPESRLLFHVDFPWLARSSVKLCLNRLIPSYSLLSTLYTVCINFKHREDCFSFKITYENNRVLFDSKEILGREIIIALILQYLFWTVIFLLHDSKVFRVFRIRTQRVLNVRPLKEISRHKDVDVEAEHRRIESNSFRDYIILKNLVKYYGKKRIIDNISVAISQGECFCVLGREQTGKSTLMRILTGHTSPTKGSVIIGMQEEPLANGCARVGMSFSPQKDALIEEFTGRDTLVFYGRLRGVPKALLSSIAQTLLSTLRISDPDRSCAYYSICDRKKLSLAAALIGEPKIIVLDEPTFGMDYLDMKTAWQLLSCIHKLQRTLIVASSNAEECAEFDRMTILATGKLVCLTTPTLLIKKYGTGYTVMAKFQKDESGKVYSQMPFLNFVIEEFTDIEIISDNDVSRLHFPNDDLNLGKVFAVMEDGVRYFHVDDYSVQKTSLNHIFYLLSGCPEEEYIEIPPGASPPFDRWPPKVSSRQPFET